MTKAQLLALLPKDVFVSGQEIGRSLGVTRAAVSKAVAGLKRDGYEIVSVPNRGYCLVSAPDLLTGSSVLAALGEHPWARTVQVLETVDSTNNELKRLAAKGAPHGTVVAADRQTAGRGRLGRSFDSAPGAGVYLSALLRPELPPAELMTLTARAAVAVRRAIRDVCGVEADIKWVNDLVLSGRKISGTLTELSLEAESGLVGYAVVGVGVNCNRPVSEFPASLQQTAGSVLSQTGQRVDRSRLAAALIRRLSRLLEDPWHEEYRSACLNLGRQVRILSARGEQLGEAVDVGPQAELLVRLSDGTLTAVNSGEVSVRGLYGYAE